MNKIKDKKRSKTVVKLGNILLSYFFISSIMRFFYSALLLVCTTALLFSCAPAKDKLYKETRSSMYTIVSITVSSDSKSKAKEAINNAFKELDRLEKMLNFYSDKSEVSKINKFASERPVKVSKETIEIISKAIYVSDKTNGAFDITMSPVIQLWDFKNKTIPNHKTIEDRLKLVGYNYISIDQTKSEVSFKKKGLQINLGGILKGYAADRAVNILKKHGIKSGIVAIAGDIKTFGKRPNGEPWRIGIQNPRAAEQPLKPLKNAMDEIVATIELSDMSISTSGDYERFFEKDGVRYHHLLSPQTGYPAKGLQSVSIITQDCVFTDAFATGIFIAGLQKGMEILKENGLDGVIIDKDGNIHATEGAKDIIKFYKFN